MFFDSRKDGEKYETKYKNYIKAYSRNPIYIILHEKSDLVTIEVFGYKTKPYHIDDEKYRQGYRIEFKKHINDWDK